MMIHAYQETYLSKAQATLGDAFDYAINDCDIGGDDFIELFLGNQISKQFEIGDPSIVLGKSGIEIVFDIIDEKLIKEPIEKYNRTKEYWIGWAIAYYQWYSNRSFEEIFLAITYEYLENLYYTLHEADISKFVDVLDRTIKEYYKETNLKRLRQQYGCSQSYLADMSNVSLRSIQMYEQRNKDINKASGQTLYKLSKALGCSIEDLLEK